MEITEQNCRFRTRDDEYEKNQEEKSKHVVHLARPEGIKYEEQLYKYATEWQDTTHDDSGHWLRVEILLWYLPRNLIRSYRMLQSPFLEAKVSADKR